jgi:hypothetical protein
MINRISAKRWRLAIAASASLVALACASSGSNNLPGVASAGSGASSAAGGASTGGGALAGASSSGAGAGGANAGAGSSGAAAGGSAGGSAGQAAQSTLSLPVEVLSDGSSANPFVAEVALRVDAASLANAAQLWFQCHRCGFYGDPEWEATTASPQKVKASFRVLGGSADESVAWIDITDATVTLADSERVHGGINGGLFSTQITVLLDAKTKSRLVSLPALNKVQFRFNGTDGASNGFRILDLALRDAQGKDIGADTRSYVDPQVEKLAGTVMTPDVSAGQALWYAQDSLAKSAIVTRKVHAACSSCHAPDGRDLQYFGYSNNAIVKRSQFHGLSAAQGAQIAAFLRYSLRGVPNAPLGRPWNPPYQPGPGLDAKPEQWAAGAGLRAVLGSVSEGVKALFGKDASKPLLLSQADVDAVMSAKATLNVRETPIPMQFPDWNAWLPTLHPLDVWPDGAAATGSFAKGGVFGNGSHDPVAKLSALKQWLQNPNKVLGDYSHLTPDERSQAQDHFTNWGWDAYDFLGGGRGGHEAVAGQPLWGAQVGANTLKANAAAATVAAGPSGAFSDQAYIERATSSLLHWLVVQEWGLAQQYGLEGNQAWFIGDKDAAGAWHGRGEAHGWPFNSPSTFYLAPHMLYEQEGNRVNYFAWESKNVVASYYRTNQWYQLQLAINSGGQSGWGNYPMDWPYLTGFDELLAQAVGSSAPAEADAQATHYLRLLEGQIKSAQYVNNALPLSDQNPDVILNVGRYSRAQALKHLEPANYMANSATSHSEYSGFESLQPGLPLLILNGAIALFNDLYASTQPSQWRRCDPNNTVLGGPEQYAGFRYCLDQSVDPLLKDNSGVYYLQGGVTTSAQSLSYAVWKAQQLGAESTRLGVFSGWVTKMWPGG